MGLPRARRGEVSLKTRPRRLTSPFRDSLPASCSATGGVVLPSGSIPQPPRFFCRSAESCFGSPFSLVSVLLLDLFDCVLSASCLVGPFRRIRRCAFFGLLCMRRDFPKRVFRGENPFPCQQRRGFFFRDFRVKKIASPAPDENCSALKRRSSYSSPFLCPWNDSPTPTQGTLQPASCKNEPPCVVSPKQ